VTVRIRLIRECRPDDYVELRTSPTFGTAQPLLCSRLLHDELICDTATMSWPETTAPLGRMAMPGTATRRKRPACSRRPGTARQMRILYTTKKQLRDNHH
jgi:predicted amidophosphoribosyltransferase